MADGACKICRAGWFADYPTYDNFMYDLFAHRRRSAGTTTGTRTPSSTSWSTRPSRRPTLTSRPSCSNEAETILLDDVGVIPIIWYRGDYVFNEDEVGGFTQTNFGLIHYEKVFRQELNQGP